jgi:hypothetical protein
LVRPGGWRKAATLTPGLVKDALARRFRDFEAFRLVPQHAANRNRPVAPDHLGAPPQHERLAPRPFSSDRLRPTEQPDQTVALDGARLN